MQPVIYLQLKFGYVFTYTHVILYRQWEIPRTWEFGLLVVEWTIKNDVVVIWEDY